MYFLLFGCYNSCDNVKIKNGVCYNLMQGNNSATFAIVIVAKNYNCSYIDIYVIIFCVFIRKMEMYF